VPVKPLVSENVIFQSGFESGVTIEAPNGIGGQWWQSIVGEDSKSNWARDLPDRASSRFQYLVPSEKSLKDYVETRIDSVIGPHGIPTNALFMAVKTYDKAGFGHGWLTRNQYNLLWDATFKQAYARYWMKFQPDLNAVMPNNSWRNLMEWRESGDDYRWSLYVIRSHKGGPLFWEVEAQLGVLGNSPVDWRIVNTDVPVPIGEWFLLEVFWRHSGDDGRVWVAINGKTIADHSGRNKKDSNLNKWNIFKVYTGENSLDGGTAYQWIDDFEIDTDIPVNR